MTSSRMIASVPKKCYEDFYCVRGNMENQIKQQYLDLDADRTSTHWMASNQLRLWFSAFALLLFQRLCSLALQGTELAEGDCRHDPATIIKDWRHDHGQHAPDLHSARFDISPLQNLFAQAHRALAEWASEEG